MRKRLASYRITALGWILLGLVPALVLLGVLGPDGAQMPSFIAALVLAMFVVGSTGFFSVNRSTGSNLEAVRRATGDLGPGKGAQTIEQETNDPAAWHRERERRERAQRGRGPADSGP